MSFSQVTPSWECDNHIIDTQITDPYLELNQENVNLLNNHQHVINFPPESSFGQKNGYIASSSEPYPSQTDFPDCEMIDSFLFDRDANSYDTLNGRLQTSSEASPNIVDSVISPETSETSGVGGYESEIKTIPHLSERSLSSSSAESFKPAKKSKSKKQLSDEQDAALIARDDSELTEEELQLKRKAQNRAAQRAFRERKQTKLKELEEKLLQSEEERNKLFEELNLIKKQNITISTENEILRSNYKSHKEHNDSMEQNKPITTFNFPQNQDDFIQHIVKGTDHHVFQETKNKVYDNDGDKLLALGAVWDYIQIKAEEADLEFNSLDINAIMRELRGHERCHGYGPAYPLHLVNEAIQSSLQQE
ncbi:Fluconazole resistance protein 3 [Spathaspora sp. JA1]|nr:Fluconazole resistance protein 3 [Spathaspora sp. JA1]